MSLSLEQTVERGLETIYTLVCSLSLPYSTMYIASNLLQKAYLMPDVQRRFRDRKYYDVAVGTLYIALKLEEYRINNEEIINVINRKAKKNEDLLIKSNSDEYSKWKRIILYMEPYLLHQLNFKLDLTDPFGLLTIIRRKHNLSFGFFQLAHTILGDCCHVDICLRADAQTLIAASLHFAACILEIEPFTTLEIDSDGLWGFCELKDIKLDIVESCAFELLKLYRERQNLPFDNVFTPLPLTSQAPNADKVLVAQISADFDDELEEGEMVD